MVKECATMIRIRITKWGKAHVVGDDPLVTLCGLRVRSAEQIREPKPGRGDCVQCKLELERRYWAQVGGRSSKSRLRVRPKSSRRRTAEQRAKWRERRRRMGRGR